MPSRRPASTLLRAAESPCPNVAGCVNDLASFKRATQSNGFIESIHKQCRIAPPGILARLGMDARAVCCRATIRRRTGPTRCSDEIAPPQAATDLRRDLCHGGRRQIIALARTSSIDLARGHTALSALQRLPAQPTP